MTKIKLAETKLERVVQRWINERISEYEDGQIKSVLDDLFRGGCSSGIVGELIYYSDTTAFYNKHKDEINSLLKETLEMTGYKSPAELFGDKWDSEDSLALEDTNQNLLAWFGFEETARNLANKAGIEV